MSASTTYTLSDFDYALPPELIAQHPAAERSGSRLLDGRGASPVDRTFRELPALVAALERLPQVPDLVFVDGQGIAHPRRLGIAAHFGVVTGLPSIGVAKNVLCGRHETPGPLAGERTPLIHRGDQIGWVLRSKPRCNPLIVSPGHRVSMQGALDGVLRTLRGYRLPEPTRLADRLASRRG